MASTRNSTISTMARLKSPILGNWRYFNGEVAGPGDYFASDADLAQAWIDTAPGSPQCGGTTVVGTGAWVTVTTESGYGGVVSRERREYHRSIHNFSSGTCHLFEDNLTFVRDRSVTCPQHYGPQNGGLPGCKVSLTARILGTLNYCEGCDSDSGQRGNPVNAVTGDKIETEVDYSGPFGLQLTRTYHSRSLDRNARYGMGWTTNYHRHFASVNRGGLVTATGVVENFDAVGSSSTHLMSTAGTSRQYKKIATDTWYLYYQDGSVDVHSDTGLLKEIRTPQGLASQVAYDSSGRLYTVTDPFGHQLKFEYNADGKVNRVTRPDGLFIDYSYSGEVLSQVDYPDGSARVYHYEDPTFPYHLTGITDENNVRFSTFAYDSTGRPQLSEHAGGVSRYQFAYGTSNSTVTDPLGTNEVFVIHDDLYSFTKDYAVGKKRNQCGLHHAQLHH